MARSRLQWAGHVETMKGEWLTKRTDVSEWKVKGDSETGSMMEEEK